MSTSARPIWGRMQGLISLEVYGHLHLQTGDPAKLYHAELLDLIRSLGLEMEHARRPRTPQSSA